MDVGRRRVLGSMAAVTSAAAVGCTTDGSDSAESSPTGPTTTTSTTTTTAAGAGTAATSADTTAVSRPWADAGFDELERYLADTNTNSFAIWEDGDSVFEWHRDDPEFRRDIASAQKSVLSLLVGRAVADGLIALDTEVGEVVGADWAGGSPTAGITVHHLLAMTSGLDNQLQVVSAPGEAWLYSGAFAALFDVVTSVTGEELQPLAQSWLFDDAGATTAEFYERRIDSYAPIGLVASTSDLVAIGRTVVEGTQAGLDPTWLDDSLTPSQPFNEGYGHLWWLNGHESYLYPAPGSPKREGPLIPPAPDDLVAALGKDDQKLYLSRDLRLVVARIGGRAVEGRPALSSYDPDLWTRLMELRGDA